MRLMLNTHLQCVGRGVEILESCNRIHLTPFPWQPDSRRYVLTTDEAVLHFQKQRKPVCFIGHSHIPRLWVEGAERPIEPLGCEDMRQGKRHIVNVGSVGQPRDREPEACYVIYSRERQVFRFRCVSYDVAGAQQAIIAAGLPAYYAQRLELGR
jgi:diadenosine tetraphosphatase ApaH/serine/threonine PP2A family protein phosphatase